MNGFILNTGRCGSTTFIKACEHFDNYSSGHETLIKQVRHQRLSYPKNHIEADNRLSWFLGRLDDQYGDNAFYVHLTRDIDLTVNSFIKRMDFGIMKAYKEGILMHSSKTTVPNEEIARDYVDTTNRNINLFLKDKTKKMNFMVESANQNFSEFMARINAKGELQLALDEWSTRHNES